MKFKFPSKFLNKTIMSIISYIKFIRQIYVDINVYIYRNYTSDLYVRFNFYVKCNPYSGKCNTWSVKFYVKFTSNLIRTADISLRAKGCSFVPGIIPRQYVERKVRFFVPSSFAANNWSSLFLLKFCEIMELRDY